MVFQKIKTSVLQRAILAYAIYKYRHKRVRSMYIRPIFERRNVLGESLLVNDLTNLNDEEYYRRYFRMDKEQFNLIYEKVLPHLYHSPTHARPISAKDRLCITLRYLATGAKQIHLAMSYRISPTSVSNIVKEVLAAICISMKEHIKEPTEAEWNRIRRGFGSKWNFPNALGAIDGKHIRIKSPPKSGSVFFNYKGFFSIVLLAVADHNYRFSLVDIGGCGSISDGGILKNSNIGKKMENGRLPLPPPQQLMNRQMEPVFLGDDAFPLKDYLMKPFPGRGRNELSLEQKIFNYRHSRARMVVENTFGIFQARWRIFETPIDADLETTKLIVQTCVILHNFLNLSNDFCGLTTDREIDGEIIRGSWRGVTCNDSGMHSFCQQGSNNSSVKAFEARDTYTSYFMSTAGQVAWQESSALAGYA